MFERKQTVIMSYVFEITKHFKEMYHIMFIICGKKCKPSLKKGRCDDSMYLCVSLDTRLVRTLKMATC